MSADPVPGDTLRIGIVAGEASGDILGSRLLASLKARYPILQAEGIGGPLMLAEGMQSLYPMERLSVMGLVEPLKRLPELLRIRRELFAHFVQNPPDVFLGIDSPDFNLHLEARLRSTGCRTAHLVSPSIWAWRQGRIRKIRRAVDLMLCLFPFETAIYDEHGVKAEFVGHPLADEIPLTVSKQAAREQLGLAPQGKLVGLLPGSRAGEVKMLAPLFLQCARELLRLDPSLSFVLPAANAGRRRALESLLSEYSELPVRLLDGQSRLAMAASDTLLLASGTATLEAMLYKRPMVVAYRMGALSWFVISRMVRTPFAALPNILAGRALVPEWLQHEATVDNLAGSLRAILADSNVAREQLATFDTLHRTLRLGSADRVAAALSALVDDDSHRQPDSSSALGAPGGGP